MPNAIALLTAICGFLLSTSPTTFGCTIFVASRGGVVLAGNNEDNAAGFNPDTRIWFHPPKPGCYGMMFLGYADRVPQGGMNDHGLFFDGATLPNGSQCLFGDASGKTAILELTPQKPSTHSKDEGIQLIDQMMGGCATVEEALALLESRLHADGVRFNVVRGNGDFQIATNFQQSITSGEKVTCKRFQAATKMLSGNAPLTVDLFRSILKATHQEGKVKTFYSNVCDLKNGVIYLYDRANFDRAVELRLSEELQKGERDLRLSDLFK
jgi:hypothetical protein